MEDSLDHLTDMPRYVADRCVSCGACARECPMLRQYAGDPRAYFAAYAASRLDRADCLSAYYCMVCGLCKTVCPRGLDLGLTFLRVRDDLVRENCGKVPLRALRAVEMHQRLSFHGLFTALNRGGE